MNDRRAAPRVRMLIELYGRTVPLGVPITLVNISLAGMAIRTELPLPLDVEHCFELTLPDGSTVVLDGEIARRTAGIDDCFTVGIRFTDPAAIAAVFNRITEGTATPEPAWVQSGASA
jgi:hypothetical protein